MKKIVFIINRRIKRYAKIKKSLRNRFAAEYDIDFHTTQYTGHASFIARNIVNKGTDYIVSVGGDGTINEIVNGIMTSDFKNREKIKFAILPCGTGNDFSRSIFMKKDINLLYEIIKNNKTIKTDVAEASFVSLNNYELKRFFINITEIGIGAKVVQLVNSGSKILGGTITFFISIIKAFSKYKHQKIIFEYENGKITEDIVVACAANGCFYGSGLGIAPYASINDGLLDFVIVGKIKTIDFIKHLPELRNKKPILRKEIKYAKGKWCKILSATDEQYPVEMDGEYIGYTPLYIKIIRGAIEVLVP